MMIRILLVLVLSGFSGAYAQQTRIAFLSDIHFQDLYGSFSDHEFRGITNPGTGKPVIMRTMGAQLRSTRIFNENYYAFLAALDDVAARGIKIVALPGDFSDDGQAYNLRGLRKILEEYAREYGLRFFTTTGNHDPVGPFRQEGGKSDFLGADGRPLGIYSSASLARSPGSIITKDIAPSGYREILEELKDFGLRPSPAYLYWSTPSQFIHPEEYSYAAVERYGDYRNRMYEVSPGFTVPDLSYVVEPAEGLWLLAIDGNTYIPKNTDGDPADVKNYNPSSVGYNNVMTNKTRLIAWVKQVTAEARKRNKTVVAFTHYPMIEYNDGASKEISNLLGPTKWQLHRAPAEDVARAFADAGLQVHFGGHMHINDTGIRKYEDGKMLVNIQVPSLAAYIPAYKILTVKPGNVFEIETVIVDKADRFNELFPLYEKEYEALRSAGDSRIWNKEILNTRSYREFTLFHLQELVRLRMIPSDWPKELTGQADKLNGEDFYRLSRGNPALKKRSYRRWGFNELLLDLYKFQSADELARRDIPRKRLKQYEALCRQFEHLDTEDEFRIRLKTLFRILNKISNGDPSDHFEVDLNKEKVRRLK